MSKGCGRLILEEVLLNQHELISKNPLVLSSGGIYIPLSSRRQKPFKYDILTTSNEDLPVKVVTGLRPNNILNLVLSKEAMN